MYTYSVCHSNTHKGTGTLFAASCANEFIVYWNHVTAFYTQYTE